MERDFEAAAGNPDPLEDLLVVTHERLLEWMRRKALRPAQGHTGVGRSAAGREAAGVRRRGA